MSRKEYWKLTDKINRNVDSPANEKYNSRYDNSRYQSVQKHFNYDPALCNKFVDQCLATCGHSGFSLDPKFLRDLPKEALDYLSTFSN